MSGDVSVVVSRDIGKLGPADGPPVTVTWKLTSNLARIAFGSILWIVILFLLRMENNSDERAKFILVPLAVNTIILFVIRLAVPSAIFDPVIWGTALSLSFGLSVVFLLADLFNHRGRIAMFLFMIASLAIVGIVSWYIHGDLRFSESSDRFWHIYGIEASSLSIAFLIAGFFHRLKFSRFFVWFVLANAATMSFYIVVRSAAEGHFYPFMTLGNFFVGGMYGIILFVVILPFLMLAFGNEFFRERLLMLLGNEIPGAS